MINVTHTEASAYFSSRLGAEDVWNETTPQSAALKTAESDLVDSGEFDLESPARATLVRAVCEQALFLVRQGGGLERRMELIAQGVTRAGVVDEAYNEMIAHVKRSGKWPIAPRARQALAGFEIALDAAGYAGVIKRDA